MKSRPFTRRTFVPVACVALVAGVAVSQPAGASGRPSTSSVIAALERSAAFPGTAWGVDAASHRVVVSVDASVTGNRLVAVQRVVSRYAGSVRLVHAAGVFRTEIAGGDPIYGTRYRCSLGFNVRSGNTYYFLTAGHCGKAEKRWWDTSSHRALLGATSAATFPGSDYSLVKYDTAFTNYPGTVAGNHDIASAGNARVGENVTRTGSTTGTHTGVVTALNATVHYQSGGTVRGLIQTTVCAEPGDSGGPLYDGSVALGLTSGGSGDCRSGGTTFFQPVTTALSAYGVQVY